MAFADLSGTLRGRVLDAASRSRSHALRSIKIGLFASDLFMVTVAIVVAVIGRTHLEVFQGAADVADVAKAVGVFLVAGWPIMIAVAGGYSSSRTGDGTVEYTRVLLASMAFAGAVGIVSYLTRFQLSRGLFVLFFVIGTPLLILGRFLLRRMIHRLRAHGHLSQRVLLAGPERHVDDIAQILRRERWLGYSIVGSLMPGKVLPEETSAGVPVVGSIDDVAELIGRRGADAVVFTEGALPSAAAFRRLAWALEEHRVQMIVAPALSDISSERVTVRPMAGMPLVHVDRPQGLAAGHWAKRAFDVIGGCLIVLLASPVLLFTAAWIKLNDRGPVLFRQTRIGRNGTEFSCLKFRSMVVDADKLLAQLKDLDDGNGVLFKSKVDPRITPPGRFIRRLSIDELPQLFNVIAGDMSLVGPRPPLPAEVALYAEDAMRRLRVRPGMTGLWQVSGRSDLSWDETVRLDLYYVDNWSPLQDLTILARTVTAVVSGRGAY